MYYKVGEFAKDFHKFGYITCSTQSLVWAKTSNLTPPGKVNLKLNRYKIIEIVLVNHSP